MEVRDDVLIFMVFNEGDEEVAERLPWALDLHRDDPEVAQRSDRVYVNNER